MTKKGVLLVFSGPSGSGKGTIISSVFEKSDKFSYSVSATTRAPREGEIDGVHYHFISREEFENLIKEEKVLEYTEYCGNYYGTLKSAVDSKLEEGFNVILEIDVEGAMQIKTKYRNAVLVLIIPPNYKTLEERLRSRGTDSDIDISNRLERSKEEMRYFTQYDYFIVNYDNHIEEAADQLIEIAEVESHSTKNCPTFVKEFFEE